MKFIASVSTILILIKISLLKETSTAEPLSETATLTSEYYTEKASLGSFKIVIKNHWKTLYMCMHVCDNYSVHCNIIHL